MLLSRSPKLTVEVSTSTIWVKNAARSEAMEPHPPNRRCRFSAASRYTSRYLGAAVLPQE